MAESQVLFPYDQPSLEALQAAISAPRFGTYLSAAGHDPAYALGLYLYNARLAKSLLYPLHMAEVSLRNGVHALLTELYGKDWPTDVTFRGILTPESLQALDKAIARAGEEKGPNPSPGQIVATLTFDFWSNLFRPEYDRPIWQVHLRKVLPHLPKGRTRADVQTVVKAINRLRNRIAHHEPIFRWDVSGSYRTIVDLIGARCPVTADWVKHHSTVGAVLRSKPNAKLARRPTVGEVCDPNFVTVSGTDSLAVALKTYDPTVAAIVRVSEGRPTAVLTAAQILYFASQKSDSLGGMIDLNDHTIDGVVAAQGLERAWVGMKAGEPMAIAVRALQNAQIRALVLTEDDDDTVVSGVLLRAHRRY